MVGSAVVMQRMTYYERVAGVRATEEGIIAHERGGIREGCPGDMQGVGDLRKALLFIASGDIYTLAVQSASEPGDRQARSLEGA